MFDTVKLYDFCMAPLEKGALGRWRRDLCGRAQGRVLEVGCGSGANFSYYPPELEIVAVDQNPAMLEKARARAALAMSPIQLLDANLENLPLEDRSVDTILSTLVFCSVPDPVRGLGELRRVLRTEGRLYMVEHVGSHKHLPKLLLEALTCWSSRYGEYFNRDTEENLKLAGWKILEVENLFADVVKFITATPGKG